MKKLILTALLLFVPSFFSWLLAKQNVNEELYQTVCYMIYNKVQVDEDTLAPWFKSCMQSSFDVTGFETKTDLILKFQAKADQLGVHHLYFMTPSEEIFKKQGNALSTGLVSQIKNGQLVVKKVIADSPAFREGVRPNDVIVSLKEKDIYYPSQTFNTAGTYTFSRMDNGQETQYTVHIPLSEIHVDLSVKVSEESAVVARLEVPSFYSAVFSKKMITQISQKLKKYKKVKIDLRDNSGGHVISALRMLSLFTCRSVNVGGFYKSRGQFREVATLKDQDDFTDEYEQFFHLKALELNTFDGYGCFNGQIEVLVNSDTGSVSEIFAQAIKELGLGKVTGDRTSGQAVMALRYELLELGPGFSIVIPEAEYVTSRGTKINGIGVETSY